MEADDQRIRVAIRVRCLNNKEKDKNKLAQWNVTDHRLWQIDPKSENKVGPVYTFDHVYGMESRTKDIFEELVKPIVKSCVQGFNGTIFAYGQTSSGKTYTMMGDKAEDGVIPLSVNHLFKTVEDIPNRDFLVRVSYMEIYNEHIRDLLEPKNSNLKIHEDSSGQAYVTLKEEITDTPEKVLGVMKRGEKNRTVGSTDINERSSRSHTIFRIIIESRKHQGSDFSENFDWDDAMQVSILNLVDLAGSERVVQTKATGDRFKEGCAINKSLFYLGNVIAHLSEGSGQYVNFRDSKLTRILRTSLGGNAHTAIICTVTPASVEETISTLSFASRAMCVKNEPHVNEIITDECLMRRHAAMVKKLEQELEKARQDNECSTIKKELEEKEKIIGQLRDWIQRDQMRFSSPQLMSRSDRRKTWAASELQETLKRNRQERLGSLLEEAADPDYIMDSTMQEYEDESEVETRNVSSRRSSINLKRVSRLPIRSSLQNLSSSSSAQIRRFSYDENEKRRKRETEVFERLTTGQIDDSKKVLYEAITKLKGSRPIADADTCTLVELVTEVGSLAGTLEPMVNKSNSSLEHSEKLSSLESLLEKTKAELDKISFEKNELQSVLKMEQEKCFELNNQLKEALEKLEEYSKVIEKNDLSKELSTFDKSRVGEEEIDKLVKASSDELVKRLNGQTDEMVKLKNELHDKILDLENKNAIVKEYKALLDEERIKAEIMEVKLKEALSKPISCGTRLQEQLVKWAEEIIALKGQLEYCSHNLSNIKPAYSEWEHFSSFDVDVNLQQSLDIVKTVFMQLNELSEKLKSTELNTEPLPENETSKCTIADSTHEIIPVECIKAEPKDVFNNTFQSSNDISMNCGLVDQGLDESMLLNYKEKICGLEIELQKSNERLYNFMSEKRSLEELLVIEREQFKNSEGRLHDALHQIETLLCNLNEATEKFKSNEDVFASKLAIQLERIAYLEDELEASEFVVANLAVSEEEAILDLKELTEKVKMLEESLKKEEEKLMSVFEENDRIKIEMSTRENELSAMLSEQVKNISKLEGTVEEYKSQLNRMSALEGSYKTEVSSMETEFREKILKLEEDLQRYSGELMKLGLEKGEIESQLVTEKEKYGIVCMQLNKAIAKMDYVNEELKTYFKIEAIDEPKTKEGIQNIGNMDGTSEKNEMEENCNSEQLQKNMEKVVQMFEKYVLKISKIHLEKKELESMLHLAKESRDNITKQLDHALNTVENLTKQLSETSHMHKEEENRLESLVVDERTKVKILEDELVKKQTDFDELCSKVEELDNLVSEEMFAKQVSDSETASKIFDYEQKIAELEKVLLKNSSDILKLESGKAELESIVITISTNCDLISTELFEALGNVDLLTKEYEELSVKHKDAEKKLESTAMHQETEVLAIKTQLENVEYALSVCTKSEQDLENLLTVEKGKVADLQKQLDEEKNKEKVTNDENLELSSSLLALKEELKLIKDQHQNCEVHELNSIKANEAQCNELRELEMKFTDSKLKIEELEGMLVSKVAEVQKENDRVTSLLELSNKKINDLEDNVKALNENLDMKSQAFEDATAKVVQLQGDLEVTRLAEGNIESLLNEEKEKGRKLELELLEKEDNLQTLTSEINSLKSDSEKALEKCKIMEQELEMKSLEVQQMSSVVQERDDLRSSLTSVQAEYDSTKVRLQDALQDIDTISKKLIEVANECERLKAKESEVLAIKTQLENVEYALSVCTKSEQDLENLLTVEKGKVADLQKQLDEEKNKEKVANDENLELSSSLLALKEELKLIKDQHQNCEVHELNSIKANEAQCNELKELEMKFTDSKLKIEELEGMLDSKVAEVQKENDRVTSLLELSNKKIYDLEDNVKALNENLDMKSQAFEDATAKVVQLQGDLEVTRLAEVNIESLLNEEKEKGRKLELELLVKEDNLQTLTSEINSLKSDSEKALEKCKIMEQELEMKSLEVQQMSSVVQERDDLRSSLTSVQAEYDSTKVRLQDALQDIDTISKKLIEVANECERLKAKESEVLAIKTQLENVEYALSVCTKSEQDLENLLTVEKGKVADLQKQLDEEKNKEKVANDENLELSSSLLALKEELKLIKDQHQNCEVHELNSIKANEAQCNELKELEMKFTDSKLKIEELEGMLDSKVAEVQKENDRVTSLLELSNKKIYDLEDNVKALNENLDMKSQAFEDATAKVVQLQGDLEVTRLAEVNIESLLNEEKEKGRKLELELLVKEDNLQTLTSEINSLKSDSEKALEKCKIMEQELEMKSLEVQQMSSVVQERDDLRSSLTSVQAEYDSTKVRLQDALQDIDTISKKLIEVANECERLKAKESEVLAIKTQLENVEYALSVCTKSEQDLENLLTVEKGKVADLQKQLDEEKNKEKVANDENLELSSSLLALKEELKLIKDQHQNCEVHELTWIKTNEAQCNELRELEMKLTDSKLKIEELEGMLDSKVAEVQKENDRVTSLLELSNKKINDLEDNVKALNENLDMKSQAFEDATAKVVQLQGDLEVTRLAEGNIESLLNEEKEKGRKLELELLVKEDNLQTLTSEINSLKSDSEKALEKCKIMEQELEMKSLEVQQMSSVVQERDDLRSSLTSVQAEYDSTKVRLQDALQDIDTISKKLIEVANECERLKAKESEVLAIKTQLENVEYALSVCTKSEQDLENLLTVEKGKVADLQKQLDEEKNKEKVANDENLELSSSLLALKEELKLIKDQHQNCEVHELTWIKTNEAQCNELRELEMKLTDSKLKIEELEGMLDSKVAEVQKENDRVTSLLELSNKKINDLEDNVKALNENLDMKSQAFEDATAKVVQLQCDLKVAESKLLGVSELNENKIKMLENLLQAENKKFELKLEEMESLQLHKKELVELFKADKARVSMLEEEIKSLQAEIDNQLTNTNKLKILEIELRSNVDVEKQKRVHVENELKKAQSDLDQSQFCLNDLKSEIQCLTTKLQQETVKCLELHNLLDKEKEACSLAREAEKRLVSVLSVQEKAISALESVKGVAGTDIKAFNDIIQEKENKIIELSEELRGMEKYSKEMEKMAETWERRRDIVLDHRIEIQNKARETEEKLIKEIAELKNANSRAVKCKCSEMEMAMAAERVKIEDLQTKLQSALREVKDSRSQVGEYQKELQRCKLLLHVGVNDTTNVFECGVQTDPTTQPEVLDIRPDGSSVVQYYKIDLLEQKVRKLEEEKEMLKKLCRRRHDQREELKIQVESLTNKIKGLEKTGENKENKENMNTNL